MGQGSAIFDHKMFPIASAFIIFAEQKDAFALFAEIIAGGIRSVRK